MGFNVLIADDKGSDINKAKDVISKSNIGKYIDNIYSCQFIKNKFNCPPSEKTFLELLPDIENLDFAFVDLSWDDDKDFSSYSEGGKFIIQELINKKYFNCLIIPLTKEIGENISPEDQVFRFKSSNEELILESISKKADVQTQIERLNYIYLTNWLLPFLSRINNKEILQTISDHLNGDKTNKYFELNSRTWEASKLIYNAVGLLPDMEETLQKGIGFTHPNGVYNWSNSNPNTGGAKPKYGKKVFKPKPVDLVYIYKLYLELDKKNGKRKTEEINTIASNLIKEYFASKDQHRSLEKIQVTEVKIYDNNLKCLTSVDANDLKLYYNLLIWRRFILCLNKLTESIIANFEIYKLYSTANVGPNSINKFFNYLGFKVTRGFIDQNCFLKDNCFPEENNWLKNQKLQE